MNKFLNVLKDQINDILADVSIITAIAGLILYFCPGCRITAEILITIAFAIFAVILLLIFSSICVENVKHNSEKILAKRKEHKNGHK